MANSKSEQHIINLANPDLNRERLKGEIKPWDGFNDRNSPYLSGECLPLYTKTISGSNQWISPSLDAYKMYYDGRLMKNGVPFGPTMKSSFSKVNLNPPTGYPDILAGTPNCYICGNQGQDGIKIKFASSTYDQPITYGTGFDWETCISYLGVNYIIISDRSWTGICWGGKCFVYSYGTLYTSPYTLSASSSSVENKNVCIANVGTKLYFGCTHGNSIIVFDTSNQTWTNLSTITWKVYGPGGAILDTGTVSANKVCMDQLGGCSLCVKGNTYHTRDACAEATYTVGEGASYRAVTIQSSIYYGSGHFSDSNEIMIYTGDQVEVWPSTWYSSFFGYDLPLVTWSGQKDRDDNPISYQTCDYYEDDTLASDVKAYSRYGIFETQKAFKSARSDDAILYNLQLVSSSFSEGMTTLPLDYNQYPWGSGRKITQWTRTSENVRVLFNKGIPVNASLFEQTAARGNILMPWGSMQDFWCDHNSMMFKDQNGNFIGLAMGAPEYITYSVFRDRYILLRTSSYWNAYDTQNDVWLHYADDWNNRFYVGWKLDDSDWTIVASGYASQYILMSYPFPGAEFDKFMYRYAPAFSDTLDPLDCNFVTPSGIRNKEDGVDIYWTGAGLRSDTDDGSVTFTPTYFRTWLNRWVTRDYGSNVVWRTDSNIFNIPMSTDFQTDLYTLFILPDNTSALALQQQGGEYLIYYQGTNNNNFTRFCCVQSMFYGVTNDGVYSLEIVDSVISNSKKIADISRLTYVAYTPMCIYFWSDANRSTYLFTGDAVLRPITGCSSFSRVSKCKYKPDTLETFMMTDQGIYVSAADYCYKVPQGNIQATDIFFTNDGFAVKGLYECVCFSYYKKTDYTTLVPMVLETMLYGAGNNVVTTTDCIYLRFFRGDIGNTTANVKISGHTLTDFSSELQDNTGKTYTITKDDWDTTTDTYYLRYQPTYQKGLGISIRVESDVPLIYMGFGAKPETLQITQK